MAELRIKNVLAGDVISVWDELTRDQCYHGVVPALDPPNAPITEVVLNLPTVTLTREVSVCVRASHMESYFKANITLHDKFHNVVHVHRTESFPSILSCCPEMLELERQLEDL